MATNEAILAAFTSGAVPDRNDEAANVVDVIDDLAKATRSVAYAIMPDAMPGHDDAGGTVASLTEAVMGVTAGLLAIAGALDRLADAVERK